MNCEGLEKLRIAILRQAVTDYIEALKDGKRGSAKSLERFFKSDWGELLSDSNGDYIIYTCKQRARRR